MEYFVPIFFPYLNFLVGVLYAFLAFYVLFKSPNSLVNKLCFAFLASFSIWSFGIIGIKNLQTTKEVAMFSENFASVGWASFSMFFVFFTLVFTGRKNLYTFKPFVVFWSGLAAVFILLQWNGFLIYDFASDWFGWLPVWRNNGVSLFFYVYYISGILVSFILLIVEIVRSASRQKKMQAGIIAATLLIGFVGGTFLDIIVPRFGIKNIPQGAHIVMLIWALGLVYAMLKYRLFKITPETAAQNIINTMEDLLFLLDAEGRVISTNIAVQKKLGYDNLDITGKLFSAFFPAGKAGDLIGKIAAMEKINNEEMAIIDKSGATKYFLVSTSPMGRDENKLFGSVIVARDINEIKEARNTLEKKVQELEKLNKLMVGRELKMAELKKELKVKDIKS